MIELTGSVLRKVVAEGSKSEHAAVVLQTDDGGEFRLRRIGANAFQDDQLEALVGRRIRAAGDLAGVTLLMREWSEI